MKKYLSYIFLLAFLLGINGKNIIAANLQAPINLKASLIEGKELPTVKLEWENPQDSLVPTHFAVYYASAEISDPTKFKNLITFKNENKTSFEFSKLGPGEYSLFLVSLYLEDGKKLYSPSSNIVLVKIEKVEKPYIKFASKPANEGYVKLKPNEVWNYLPKISTNLKSDIHFALEGKYPSTLTIDTLTGELNYTADLGVYGFSLIAYSVDNPKVNARQEIKIKVDTNVIDPKPEHCALIKGTIKFADGSPARGVVYAWNKNKNVEKYVLKDENEDDGSFELEAYEGTYVLETIGKGYFHEWYNNASELANAELITVKCGDTINIDFVVDAIPTPKKFVLKGKVTDASTNDPIQAKIYFQIAEVLPGMPADKEIYKKQFLAETNKNGEYSIELADSYKYIARAEAKEKSKLYISQFFDGVYTPTEATKLSVADTTLSVDFALNSKFISESGSISGKVVDTANVGIKSKIIARAITKIPNNERYIAFTETDDSGNFTLDKLVYGTYVIESVPFDKALVPGYYKENDFVVRKWKQATEIKISESANSSITIKHLAKKEKGIVKIKGTIREKDGKGIVYGVEEENTKPIAGAYIFLVDKNNDVIDYANTDDIGTFALNNVAAGVNTLISDKVGYDSYETTIESDMESKSDQNVDITLDPEAVTGIEENVIDNSEINVFPMPAFNNASIKFDGSKGIALIRILGINGQELKSMTADLSLSNTFSFDVSNLAIGSYIVIVETEFSVKASKLIISR